MARVIVTNGPVEHDGARYNDGDELPIAPTAAEQLLGLGVVAVVEVATKARKSRQADDDAGAQE